jgi:hypothetical protein
LRAFQVKLRVRFALIGQDVTNRVKWRPSGSGWSRWTVKGMDSV